MTGSEYCYYLKNVQGAEGKTRARRGRRALEIGKSMTERNTGIRGGFIKET